MIPRQLLAEPENTSLKKFSLEPIRYSTKVDEDEKIIVRTMLMETGDMDASINTAKASIASMMKPVEVEFESSTTDDIRKRRMTPKQLVDWFLKSHIHFLNRVVRGSTE